MALGWLLKRLLSKLGSHTPKRVFGWLESAVNYLHVGRWMKDRRFVAMYLLKERRELFETVAKIICDAEVLYLEFGVWKGDTIRQWSALLKNRESRLHGFDSFEGLPEEWDHHSASALGKGTFSTGGSIPEVTDNRVKFFKGWFEETLPKYDFIDSPVVVLFVDADLYSSASLILKTLRPHIKVGTIIYFDEFWDRCHELRAFEEFLVETQFSFELLAATYGMRNVAFRRIE
jgi:hypothetical protein